MVREFGKVEDARPYTRCDLKVAMVDVAFDLVGVAALSLSRFRFLIRRILGRRRSDHWRVVLRLVAGSAIRVHRNLVATRMHLLIQEAECDGGVFWFRIGRCL